MIKEAGVGPFSKRSVCQNEYKSLHYVSRYFHSSFLWANPSLFFVYSRLFQTKNSIFTTKQCEKCPSSIRRRDSNPQLLKHELSPNHYTRAPVVLLLSFLSNVTIWNRLDPSYELSKAIVSAPMQQYQPKLLNETLFCPFDDDASSCAISVRKEEPCLETIDQKKELLHVSPF